MSVVKQSKLVALALVSGTAMLWALAPTPSGASAAPSRPGGHTHAPMQLTPPGGPQLLPADTVDSTNWSGYAVTGSGLSSVSASWVEPAATCTAKRAYSSAWVGLDGYNSTTVEQTGTDSDCAGGTGRYYAWYEMYPAGSVNISEPVAPGDAMSASVTGAATGSFHLTITDTTKGWTKTFTKTLAGAKRSSAEVIEEAPCCTPGGGILPLADFGKIHFTDSLVDGAVIGGQSPKRIDMVSAGGVVKDTTTPLSNGENFTDTWDHS